MIKSLKFNVSFKHLSVKHFTNKYKKNIVKSININYTKYHIICVFHMHFIIIMNCVTIIERYKGLFSKFLLYFLKVA